MVIRDRELEGKGIVPPYGPTRGTIQALQLLRRTTPTRIDSDYLRVNRVAPGNEYKVVGALRYLGLIDDEGRPTESSRLLKTKGATYTLALQDIVRNGYAGIFQKMRPKEITRDGIYNYFVTESGLGSEMATKATRFLIKLCRLAEIELAPDTTQTPAGGKRRPRSQRQTFQQYKQESGQSELTVTPSPSFPFVLALTPETAAMNVEELTDLFRKMRVAFEQSLAN